jgi:hypothetical protein
VLAPGIATGGQTWHAVTDRADAHERIGAVIERLHAGGDH